MARIPSSGRGRWRILRVRSLENPLFGCSAQLLEPLFGASLSVDSNHWLSAREPVTDPRPVLEHQLQSVFADYFRHLAAEEVLGIGLHLSSELLFDLGGQAEVLSARVIGTNFGK